MLLFTLACLILSNMLASLLLIVFYMAKGDEGLGEDESLRGINIWEDKCDLCGYSHTALKELAQAELKRKIQVKCTHYANMF